MTLTKSDMVDRLMESTDLNRKVCTDALESLLEIIKGTLGGGEDVLVSGFGKFCVKSKSQRRGRNPATGKALMIRPHRVVTFKCSGKLRARVNKHGRMKPAISGVRDKRL